MTRYTIDLNDTWDIVFDPDNKGRELNWQQPASFGNEAEIESINVPACWETIRQDYEGVAWYRRTFDGPESAEGKSVRLCFDAVNYIAEVWLNGSPVGSHEGGFTNFEIEVSDTIQPKGNVLILRVLGPIVERDVVIDGLGPNDAPHWRGAITGGIWQPVRLKVADATYISDVFVQPDIHSMTATVEVAIEHCRNAATNTTLNLSIPSMTEQSLEMLVQPGGNIVKVDFPMTNAELWDMDNPKLYTVTAAIDTDSTTARFGMREFSVTDKKFTLNGNPIYLKAAFHEGLYAHTLAWPEPEVVKRELELAKEAGFNMIRPWRKPPPPHVYDMADEMGIMFVGSLPVECMIYWPATGPHMRRRIEIELRESILRDRNHACIVQWEIFNEIHRPELKRLKRPMMVLARDLDPTRMIVDESGGFTGASVSLPGSREASSYNEVHTYPGGPLDEGSYNRLSKLGNDPDVPISKHSEHVEDALIYVSEIGYGSPPELDANCEEFERNGNPLNPAYRYHHEVRDGFERDLKASGFDHLFSGIDDFCRKQQELHADANSRMLEAVRLNPEIAGFCLHAFTDGDWVLGASLLDLFRNPKKPYYAACKSNAKRYLAIHTESTVWAGDEVEVKISLVNELDPISGTVECVVSSADGNTAAEFSSPAEACPGVNTLMVKPFTPTNPSKYTVEAKIVDDGGRTVAENNTPLLALAPITSDAKVIIAGLPSHVETFLCDLGITCLPTTDLAPGVPLLIGDLGEDAAISGREVLDFAAQGGTVICVALPWGEPRRGTKRTIEVDWLPQPLTVRSSKGLWTGVPHIILDHPISKGLPCDCIMDTHYESVHPINTILDLDNPIAGSVSYCWGGGEPDRGYLGPKGNFWGTDLGELPHGNGKFILSMLRIVPQLASKPVAQTLLVNMINYAQGE